MAIHLCRAHATAAAAQSQTSVAATTAAPAAASASTVAAPPAAAAKASAAFHVVPPLVLSPLQRDWLEFMSTFAAKAAANELGALRADWLALPTLCRRWGIPLESAERTLTEALASLIPVFAGIPRTIESLDTCHKARVPTAAAGLASTPPAASFVWAAEVAANPGWGRPDFSSVPPPCSSCGDDEGSAVRRARSHATLGAIYTSAATPLENYLERLHPRLHLAIWHTIYGSWVASTVLTLPESEAVAVGVLSGINSPRQLLSHLRGAVNVGLPAPLVDELLEQAFEVWGDDGVYEESKEVWRGLQRSLRAKAARAKGLPAPTVADEAAERAEQAFQDQIRRSARMAAQGTQHPLFSAGQMLGVGDADVEADEHDHEHEHGPLRTHDQLHPRKHLHKGVAIGDPQHAPAPRNTQGQGQGQEHEAHGETVTDEQVEQTLRTMMANRARAAAEELAARKAAGAAAPPVSAEDRWPVPPHVLDPTGQAGMPQMPMPGAMGMGMGMGMEMGVGGGGMGGLSGSLGAALGAEQSSAASGSGSAPGSFEAGNVLRSRL